MNLIYVCVFHQQQYIELLKLLISSIVQYANIQSNTDILVVTCPAFEPIIKSAFETILPLQYFILDLHTLFEAGCARLNIFKYDQIEKYDRILYLDTDILINSDINVLLNIEISPDKMYALEEGVLTYDGATYGNMFHYDFSTIDINTTAFTSGILMFKNSASIRGLFDAINAHIHEFTSNPKHKIPLCLDQPFIVYNAVIQKKYDNQLLKAYAENNPSIINKNMIIYHFPGGPGNYVSKQQKMTQFYHKMNPSSPVPAPAVQRQRPGPFFRFARPRQSATPAPAPAPAPSTTSVSVQKSAEPQPNTVLPLIGLCVSYKYTDALKFALPVNYNHFTKLYIITQEDDTDTINLCKPFENVELVYYDFTQNGTKAFDKYGALNLLQKMVYARHPDFWYLIIDSDIILPTNFIQILLHEKLDKECLYGAYRHIAKSSSELLDLQSFINAKKYWEYDNIKHFKTNIPALGCLQLYAKPNIFHQTIYNNAERGDITFSEANFKLFCNLDTMCILHLGIPQVNWSGKVESFVDDANIRTDALYFTYMKTANNQYYNAQKQLVSFGNSKTI